MQLPQHFTDFVDKLQTMHFGLLIKSNNLV